MTLALLVPNDYRQPAVLVRFGPQFNAAGQVPFKTVPAIGGREDSDGAALRAFAESGGQIFRLHRDDQTPIVRPRNRP